MSDNLIRCPYCKETIIEGVRKCKHCGEWLGDTGTEAADPTSAVRHALAAKYEVADEIGRGGMATVYKAVQKNLGREVALKVLPPQYTHDREFTERYHREARSAAGLRHPNIVTIYDEGVEGGTHYIAMELIEGEDLHERIKRQGSLGEEETRKLLAPIAEGLGYAHGKGLVHRDIKSSNILIDHDGRGVLTDFGIAHAGSGTKLTRTGTVMGTPEYMSPEQAKGEATDGRSDLYSLGVILHECATGRPPFTADTMLGVVHKIVNEAPPGFEGELGRIAGKCLAKSPEDRYQSCEDLAKALRREIPAPAAAGPGKAAARTVEKARMERPAKPEKAAKPERPPKAEKPPRPEKAPKPPQEPKPKKERSAGEKRGLLVGLIVVVGVLAIGTGALLGWQYLKGTGASSGMAAAVAPATETTTTVAPAPAPVDTKPVAAPKPAEPEKAVVVEEPKPAAKLEPAKAAAPAKVTTPAQVAPAAPEKAQPAAPQPKTGGLSLTVDPSMADLVLDGKAVGSGAVGLEGLKPGEHQVVARLKGYGDETRTVSVTAGKIESLAITLAKLTGSLRVTSEPSGTTVYVDGRQVGTTPLTIDDLEPGRVTVTLSRAGYDDAREEKTIEAGETTGINQTLTKKPVTGALVVRSEPSGARVSVNGRDRGTTPLSLGDLAPGSVTVTLSQSGYDDASQTRQIEAGKTAEASLTLSKKPSPPPAASATQGTFIRVPAGSFTTGSPSSEAGRNDDEGPQHRVTLSAFSIGKYDVTFDEYDACCAATGISKPSDQGWGRGSRPVINVSWNDAVKYCNWRSGQEGLAAAYTIRGNKVSWNRGANGYRLPTEAEWEYAARGGPSSRGYLYSASNDAGAVGWYSSNSASKTHPVGEKAGNELGIYDMSGNVWEWCWDWYGSYSSAAQTDPTGASSGDSRVSRGGSWGYDGQFLRLANRSSSVPDSRYYDLGFRLVRP